MSIKLHHLTINYYYLNDAMITAQTVRSWKKESATNFSAPKTFRVNVTKDQTFV